MQTRRHTIRKCTAARRHVEGRLPAASLAPPVPARAPCLPVADICRDAARRQHLLGPSGPEQQVRWRQNETALARFEEYRGADPRRAAFDVLTAMARAAHVGAHHVALHQALIAVVPHSERDQHCHACRGQKIALTFAWALRKSSVIQFCSNEARGREATGSFKQN